MPNDMTPTDIAAARERAMRCVFGGVTSWNNRTLLEALDALEKCRAALGRIMGDGWCDHDWMPHGEMKRPKCADMWALGVIDSAEWCAPCIAKAALERGTGPVTP